MQIKRWIKGLLGVCQTSDCTCRATRRVTWVFDFGRSSKRKLCNKHSDGFYEWKNTFIEEI